MDVGILIMGVIFIIMAKVVMDITRKNTKKEKKVNIKSNIFNKYPKIVTLIISFYSLMIKI